ncbi:MAG: hypothetical protein IJM02_06645 [Clostridia bacterium]|nr:hypothetical protein [Clostridia bacterium]
MKKTVIIAALLLALALIFTACADKKSQDEQTSETESTTAAPYETPIIFVSTTAATADSASTGKDKGTASGEKEKVTAKTGKNYSEAGSSVTRGTSQAQSAESRTQGNGKVTAPVTGPTGNSSTQRTSAPVTQRTSAPITQRTSAPASTGPNTPGTTRTPSGTTRAGEIDTDPFETPIF